MTVAASRAGTGIHVAGYRRLTDVSPPVVRPTRPVRSAGALGGHQQAVASSPLSGGRRVGSEHARLRRARSRASSPKRFGSEISQV